MAVANFTHTVPYAAPAATTFLSGHDFGGISPAAAINALLYDSPRQAVPPATPNRRQTTRTKVTKDLRDPYRNQQPPILQPPPLPPRRNEYAPPPNSYYKTEKILESEGEETQRRYYTQQVNNSPRTASKNEEAQRKYYAQQANNSPSTAKNTASNAASSTASKGKETPPQQPQEEDDGSWPNRPPGYTRIANTFNSAPEPGSKTSVHAVLDFDDDFEDYNYEDEDLEPLPPSQQKSPKPHVTPIEGPILIKNGSVPVVPLYSYPTVNNGSLVQIPILWTALSLALGLEIRGEIIRGVPCIKRFHQLFCPTAGNSYPIDRIERFIDDNKALMKRMYGEFQMSTEYGPPAREVYDNKRGVKREAKDPGPDTTPGSNQDTKNESYFAKHRQSRQSFRNNQNSESGRVDACESKVEIVTPYWASNSAGKVRAIVNTQHFEQAIHQEVCSKVQTKRCVGDCGCEQKYKWHRLLAYDPDNDCKGIFMDWFLFPSCCVCRCAPMFGN